MQRNRKLLIIELIITLLGVLLAILINFFTNDKNINDWLFERGIGTKGLIGTVIAFTVLLLVLVYFKFRHNQNSSEPKKDRPSVTQTIRAGDNSQNYQAGNNINISQKDND